MTLVVVCYFFMLGIAINSKNLDYFALINFSVLAAFDHDSPTKVLMIEQVEAG